MYRRTFLAATNGYYFISTKNNLGTFSVSEESREKEGVLEGKHEFDQGSSEIRQLEKGEWWLKHYTPPIGRVELFGQAERAFEFCDDAILDEELRRFIEETEFESERVLFIGSHGARHEYDQVMITSLSIDNGTLLGSAAAYAEREPFTDQERFPGILVRVTFDAEPADRAEITVTSGTVQHLGGDTAHTFEANIQNQ